MSGGHVLVVRLDRIGDVLICGPAIRAVAAHAERVTALVSPTGAPAAALLPGIDDVLAWDCPWITAPAPRVERAALDDLVDRLAALRLDAALILTSFHQSALPSALLLRAAGVARLAGISSDYPGSLLDVRIADPPDAPEAVRMLTVAATAGYTLPVSDDGRLRVRASGPPPSAAPDEPFVVVHPGVDAPARAYPAERWRAVVAGLIDAGRAVVVTGSPRERGLADAVATRGAVNLAGQTDLASLAALLARAAVVVAANTGPAHLAAAVGTPVVSLFAPVVPAIRWAPYGVPTVVLGDQQAACRASRARECPVPGHPCLTGVPTSDVLAAVEQLAPQRSLEAVR